MGARVIAMGRNVVRLQELARHERVEIVPMMGDEEADLKALKTHGAVDIYFDISPSEAGESMHFKSALEVESR
jgi:hypothetical protein